MIAADDSSVARIFRYVEPNFQTYVRKGIF